MGTEAGDERDPAPPERPQPGALELVKWSAILVAISLAIAALAIPILRWLGFAD
jgi:hypothetical protein